MKVTEVNRQRSAGTNRDGNGNEYVEQLPIMKNDSDQNAVEDLKTMKLLRL